MKNPSSSNTDPAVLLEQILDLGLIVEELEIEQQLLYQQLQPTAQALIAGRSPETLQLGSFLGTMEGFWNGMGQSILALEKKLDFLPESLERFSQDSENPFAEIFDKIETRLPHWYDFHATVRGFLNRIQLLQQESHLTPLGKNAIEDAWLDIQEFKDLLFESLD